MADCQKYGLLAAVIKLHQLKDLPKAINHYAMPTQAQVVFTEVFL
jgi:hypothetical protein